jgi:uncharacterized protein DUF6916
MNTPRRSFLKSGTLTALSAGFALAAPKVIFGQKSKDASADNIDYLTQWADPRGYQIPIEAQQNALFYFTRATFDPYVGDIFQAPNGWGQMVSMTLTRVSTYKMQPHTRLSTKKTRQPSSFSLMFRATDPLPLFTSIHQVSHPALGKFDLFLTPHPTDDGAILYEAVFNHI